MAKPNVIDKDYGFKEWINRVKRGGEAYVKVGIQQDTVRKPDDGKAPLDMVQIGAVHEFGAPKVNIPERPYIRAWHDSARERINKLLEALSKQFIDGKITMRQMLAKLGAFGQGGIRKFIRDLQEPPLRPKTISRKGSANPLIDTGQLVGAVHSVSVIRGVEVDRTDSK